MTNTQKIFIFLDTSIKLFILTQQELAYKEACCKLIKYFAEQDSKCTKSYFDPAWCPSKESLNFHEELFNK
jgi:hypothetical protein